MKLLQKDLIRISSKTNGRCFYCNRPAEAIDHFQPRSKYQGSVDQRFGIDIDDDENLFPSCNRCNAQKNNKSPAAFLGNWFIALSRSMRANARIGLGGGKSEMEAILEIV